MQNNTSYMDISIIVRGLTEFPKHNYIIRDNYSISAFFFFFKWTERFYCFPYKKEFMHIVITQTSNITENFAYTKT